MLSKLLFFERGLSEHISAVLATALAEVMAKDNPLVKAGLINEDRTYFSSILFAIILFLVILYALGFLTVNERYPQDHNTAKVDELCQEIQELKAIIKANFEKEVNR